MTLAVVLACIWVVQLRHGAEAAVDAGCRPTLASARHQATSGPRQLTAVKCNQADSVGLGLGVGPPTSSLRSVRAPAVVESGKRRRKSVDGTTRHLGSRYVENQSPGGVRERGRGTGVLPPMAACMSVLRRPVIRDGFFNPALNCPRLLNGERQATSNSIIVSGEAILCDENMWKTFERG